MFYQRCFCLYKQSVSLTDFNIKGIYLFCKVGQKRTGYSSIFKWFIGDYIPAISENMRKNKFWRNDSFYTSFFQSNENMFKQRLGSAKSANIVLGILNIIHFVHADQISWDPRLQAMHLIEWIIMIAVFIVGDATLVFKDK